MSLEDIIIINFFKKKKEKVDEYEDKARETTVQAADCWQSFADEQIIISDKYITFMINIIINRAIIITIFQWVYCVF